jgi:divalent metal cation (Fe/Co/Zn/Cd) transporter
VTVRPWSAASAALLFGFGVLQYVVAQATGSASLMADALHRMVDPVEDVIVLVRRWDAAATRAIGLLMVGSSVWIGLELIGHEPAERSTLAVLVGAASLAIGLAVWWLRHQAARSQRTAAARAAVAHARIDALGTVPMCAATVMARLDTPGAVVVDVLAAALTGLCTGWVGLERAVGRSLRPKRRASTANPPDRSDQRHPSGATPDRKGA